MKKQRIILVDDHEVVRLGLKSLLERHPQFDVVGEPSSAREALDQVASLKPDVVVMDIRLPGTSGIEACEIVMNIPTQKSSCLHRMQKTKCFSLPFAQAHLDTS
jgi:DNA-binding NarL/FixJ family response regulator